MTEKNSPELLPCPFCGGEAAIIEDSGHSTACEVVCSCDADIRIWGQNAQEAANIFNTRADLHADAIRQSRNDALRDAYDAVPYDPEWYDAQEIALMNNVRRKILAMIDKET